MVGFDPLHAVATWRLMAVDVGLPTLVVLVVVETMVLVFSGYVTTEHLELT